MITLTPWSTTTSMRLCRNSRRASGSRLATGSSRTSSSGRLATARVSASCARWPPESLPARCVGSRPSSSIRAVGQGGVPAGVEAGAQPEVVGHGQRGVGRGVLGDEADPRPAARGRAPGTPPSTSIVPAVGASRPTARLQQGRLAGAVGADQPDHPAGRDLQGAVRQRPGAPVPLAEAAGLQDGGHAMPASGSGPKRGSEQGLDALVVQPGRAGLDDPALQIAAQRARARRARHRSASRSRTCRRPARAADQAGVLQLPVGLEHRVRVDRQPAHHLLDGRQLVALAAAARAASPAAPAGPAAGRARRRTGR